MPVLVSVYDFNPRPREEGDGAWAVDNALS